jgi:hypothetical protein
LLESISCSISLSQQVEPPAAAGPASTAQVFHQQTNHFIFHTATRAALPLPVLKPQHLQAAHVACKVDALLLADLPLRLLQAPPANSKPAHTVKT